MNLSPEFLEFVAEHSRDLMLEFSDQGVLQQANRAACQLFAWRAGEEIHLSDIGLYLHGQELLTWSYLQRSGQASSIPAMVSYHSERMDKSLLFRLSVESHTHGIFPAYYLILTPVHHDTFDPEDYRLAEEKFYKAFHLSPDAISITRLSDGLFLEVNEGFVRLSGYSRVELMGKTSTEVHIWGDPQERMQLRAQLESRGESFREARFRVKGGELVDGQINARVINIHGEPCLISVVRDLREQKAAERALKESEKRLLMINHATNDAIWDWNLTTNQLEWNEGIHRIFGYAPEKVDTDIAWWEEKIHEDDRKRVVERIQRFIRQGEERWFDKYRFARGDGSYAYVYDKGHVITNAQGKAICMVGGMVDITARVLAEERLMIRNRQIAEYSFFNSHKIRGPLSRLLGLVKLVQLEETEEAERKNLLEKIRLAAEEIDDMIQEITKIFY